jgi:intracellular septation protein
MNQFTELAPVILFVGLWFTTRDIYLSTSVLMIAIICQVAIEYYRTGRIKPMSHVVLWSVLLFGGLTLAFRNETFIQWKPTIVNWAFASILWGSQRIGRKLLIKAALGKQLTLPDRVWARLGYGWALGFLIAGALNLVVAYNFSLDFWVAYKLVGGFALTLVYFAISVIYLMKSGHLTESPSSPAEHQ